MEASRRSFLGTVAAGGIGAVVGVVGTKKLKKSQLPGFEEEPIRIMNPSEATDNMISTFARSFGELRRGEMLFYDDEGIAIEKVSLPNDWDAYLENKKQDWRDAKKIELGKKHSIEGALDNIQVSSPHGVLKGSSAEATMISLVRENAEKITRDDEKTRNRIRYVRDAFSDFGGKETIISKLMSEHIVGLAAGESRFDSSLVSRSGAVGIFQLMPVNIRNTDLNIRRYSVDEVKSSLKKQVEIAKKLFLADWMLIERVSESLNLAHKYFDNNSRKLTEYLLFPLLLNCYNTGYPNISKVLRAFVEEYPTQKEVEEKHSKKYPDGFGYDLFWLLTRFGLEHKGAPTYGSESAAYFYKSMGMSRAIQGNIDRNTRYISPGERKYENESNSLISSKEAVGWVVGGVTGGVAAIFLKKFMKKKDNISILGAGLRTRKVISNTRRRVFLGLGGGVVALGVGGYIATNPKNPLRENLKPPEVISSGVDFAPGVGLPEAIKTSIYKANVATQVSIDKRHHSKTITPWLDRNAKSKNIAPVETREGLSRLGGRLNASFLNLSYRPREIGREALREGNVKPVGSSNHPAYLAIHPHTEELIREISQKLNAELLRQLGLDTSKYRIRLIISSGARDRAYAKKYLRNASDNSSHPYGIAFDIAHRFDVIDIKNRKSYMITKDSDPEIYMKTKKVLNKIITEMQHRYGRYQGPLYAIQEDSPPHIHITDKLGDDRSKPPFLT